MREGGAFLLIIAGLILGYFAIKGKLSCITVAFNCATSATGGGAAGAAAGAAGFTPGGGIPLPSIPGLTVPTTPPTVAPVGA